MAMGHRRPGWTVRDLWLGLPLAIASCAGPATRGTEAEPPPRVQLAPCEVRRYAGPVLCGRHEVFEDRVARAGRRLALDIVVLPALAPTPAPDPV